MSSRVATITAVADSRRTHCGPLLALGLVFCLAVSGCASQRQPQAETQAQVESGPESFETNVPDRIGTAGSETSDPIIVDASIEGIPIDRRLLGTNLPAWVGPEVLADQNFRSGALDSGTTLVRMPGGSWSNVYDWLGCEQGDPETCYWTWAARPTDFIDFLRATGLAGMWTVSVNDTAQKSAAAVAFFNGDIEDATVIGVDRLGTDWGSVGDWAQLRAANGNPDPIGILLWEVGNEVYGGKPANGGSHCASFGWEEVWTCDGTDYIAGIDGHDGALAIRAAMLTVDPDIEVGLVGVGDPSDWGDWGTEVIDAAGESIDFYIVHEYGFNESPDGEQALRRPEETWPEVIAQARRILPPGVTLAITEYNLVAVESSDTDQTMTRAMNAFFLADSIGELVVGQVSIANWWNLANGVTQSGTDYGLISIADDDFRRSPAFEAFAMWGRTGESLLDVPERLDDLRVYPTRHDDGRLTILVINLGTEQITTELVVEGLDRAVEFEMTVETISADDLNAQELIVRPAERLGSPGDVPIDLDIESWSMLLIDVRPSSS